MYKKTGYKGKRRAYKKTYKKNYYKKRNFSESRKRLTIRKIPNTLMSDKTYVKLVQSTPITLTPNNTNGYFARQQFIGNGFLDLGSGFDTPAGLKQWAAFYGKYRVVGCKIKATFTNVGTSGTPSVGAFVCGILPSKTQSGVTSSAIYDQPYCRWKQVGTSGGRDTVYISNFMTTKKMMGNRITQEDDYQGTLSLSPSNLLTIENPAILWYFSVFAHGTNNNTATIQVMLTKTYYVYFEDRNSIDSSNQANE